MSQSNIDIVRGTYEAFQRGDIPALLGALDPDVEWEVPHHDALPYGGSCKGHDGVLGFFKNLADHLDFHKFEIEAILPHGEDKVVIIGLDRTTVKGTEHTVDGEWVHVMTLKDGKITRFYEYSNPTALITAFQSKQQKA